jgi:Zn-dependent peptidase ImmA (M78 family)/transcriptional regulator with XRE-family HTH domain
MSQAANPDMIALAREARGLTQTALADAINVSQGKISKIEAGLLRASEEDVHELAKVLRFPLSFFYQSGRRFGTGPSEFYHYRKLKSVSTHALDRYHAEIDIRRLHLASLLDAVDVSAPRAFPEYDIDEFAGSAEEVARAVRATWHVPRGPVRSVTQLIEGAGGIVIHHDFGDDRIDGISRHVPPLPPLFFMNARVGGARYRYTLTHEVGHVVMHRFANPDMEDQANRFAAEFLMPASEIQPHLSYLNLGKIADLAAYWRVSMSAILQRAVDLGKVTAAQKKGLWIQMGKSGYRSREPHALEFPVEQPKSLEAVLDSHITELGYSLAELAAALNVYQDDFARLYPAKSGLRLIRSPR